MTKLKRLMQAALYGLVTALAILASGNAWANCVRNSFAEYPELPLMDWGSAQFWFGRINLASAEIQPVGTILGTAVTTAAEAKGINGDTILWICDLKDRGQLFEVFSTNGDDRVGGYDEVGKKDGLDGFYRTWFPGVAIKLTHVRSGAVFSRYYQSSKLDTYDVDEAKGKIYIRARHLSPVKAEIARVSDLSYGSGTSNYCPGNPGKAVPVMYSCTQPNGYIAFRGPGYDKSTGKVDDDNEDHAYHYIFFWARNGVAFGMRQAASLSSLPSCVVENATPEVTFGPITINELAQGETREETFTISFKCDRGVVSGTASNQTAFGLQVSSGAYVAAQSLNYVNGSQGVQYLLSDNYGSDPSVAKGVGIGLSDADSGQGMNFLGSSLSGQGFAINLPSGQAAGWYPLFRGAAPSTSDPVFAHQRRLTATLKQLPGQKVTAGRVLSTAYVIVKVQ